MTEVKKIEIEAAREGVSVGEYIVRALNSHTTMNAAAESLGVSYRTLYRHIRQEGIASETRYFVERETA